MNIVKVKVSELSGAALDWCVAKCEWVQWTFETATVDEIIQDCHYSTNWAQGGAIIEREKIGCGWSGNGYWQAYRFDTEDEFNSAFYQTGPDPLIAAMRCYVAAKLGEVVEVPAELLK